MLRRWERDETKKNALFGDGAHLSTPSRESQKRQPCVTSRVCVVSKLEKSTVVRSTFVSRTGNQYKSPREPCACPGVRRAVSVLTVPGRWRTFSGVARTKRVRARVFTLFTFKRTDYGTVLRTHHTATREPTRARCAQQGRRGVRDRVET